MRKIATLCLFVLLTSSTIGDNKLDYDALPQYRPPVVADGMRVNAMLLPKQYLALLGFRIGKHTAGDVKKRFKGATLAPVPGFHHSRGVCIRAAKNGDGTRVIFLKGEGGATRLDGFIVLSPQSSSIVFKTRCTPSNVVHRSLRIGGKLWLGMTKTTVIQFLGVPTERKGGQLIYHFEMEKKVTREEYEQLNFNSSGVSVEYPYFSITSVISLEFKAGRLVTIIVTSVEMG